MPVQDMTKVEKKVKIMIEDLSFWYGENLILKDINAHFQEKSITAIIGPSGAGKSSLLMSINRLWESIEGAKVTGKVMLKFGNSFHNIYDQGYSVLDLRRKVGMVFQVPNPLPMSIFKNVALPLIISGHKNASNMKEKVEKALKKTGLWDEVKNRLKEDASQLSVGQQQRLCIARALVLEPEIVLMDEPTSALDAVSASIIEDLMLNLKEKITIVLVSHQLDQVERLADYVFVLKDGNLFPY